MFASISKNDGSVVVMHLLSAPEDVAVMDLIKGEIDKWPTEIKSIVVSFREISRADLPQDQAFFDAWTDDGTAIIVNMPKAREIWRNKIREARAPKLADLDVAFQRAFETGADLTVIYAQKQALRDAPDDPAIEAAQNTDDLKKVWPEILVA